MEKHPLERFLWTCVFLSIFSYTIVMVVNLWSIFLSSPTVITLVNSRHPVAKISFPAIAICPTNKISRKRAISLANEISLRTNLNANKTLDYIKLFGSLYDFDYDPSTITDLLFFQKVLDNLGIDIFDAIGNITVSCEEILLECAWQNKEIDCTEIFFLQLTKVGYCCLFNYVQNTPRNGKLSLQKPRTTQAGLENGLYFKLHYNESDYFYTTFSTGAYSASIFPPNNYPDKASGGITDYFISRNMTHFIDISPTTIQTVADVAYYPIDRRQCLMDVESKAIFSTVYSENDCLTHCRTKSMIALCQCIPFMIPFVENNTICTLADVPCLNQYQVKWASYYPQGDDLPSLQKEIQNSLRCEKCYPSCESIMYNTNYNVIPLPNPWKENFSSSEVYVSFPNKYANLYKRDVVYYWYEILSNFGGIFSVFVGWSILSMIRFLIFYSYRICIVVMNL